MKKYKSNGVKKTIIFFSLFAFLLPATVLAVTFKANNSVYLSKNETIDGNLFVVGQTITIEGKVNGDIYCAGQSINISGVVSGDVNCAGQSINITGSVAGSVRVAGNSISIDNKIGHNFLAAGSTIVTSASSSIGWDMLIAGATTEARGNVGKDLYGAVANTTIAGQIGRNVNLILSDRIRSGDQGVTVNNAGGLTLTSTAKINGNLTYRSNNSAIIETGATVIGNTTHNLPTASQAKRGFNFLGWFWLRLFSIFSALIIGLVLISLWHEEIKAITDLMPSKIGSSIGWGVILMLLTPILTVLLFITIIGLPLGFIIIGLWLIALMISKVLVGIMIGRSILNSLWTAQKDSLIWAMIIGIIITYLVYAIPFLGWLLALMAMWWGLGGLWQYFKKR